MSDEPMIRLKPTNADGSPLVTKRKPALGRGLGALLGESRREEQLAPEGRDTAGGSAEAGGLAMLALSLIHI